MILRRLIIALAVGALLLPRLALAQAAGQPLRTIGVLTSSDVVALPVFFDALRKLGYEDGKNARILVRAANSNYARLPALARELVDAKVEVIVAINTPGARAAVDATKTIPVVASGVGDPIGSGVVTNLARPGGNVTGVSNMAGELGGKRLSLFNEMVPGAKRIAVLYNPVDPVNDPQMRDMKLIAPKLGVDVRFFPAKAPADLPVVFQEVLAWRAQSVVMLVGQAVAYEPGMIALSARNRLPFMSNGKYGVGLGGLISYTANYDDVQRRTAAYVDKILRGANPGDLPVEQPTEFELVVNLKTAKALGLKVPQSILLQATEVIK